MTGHEKFQTLIDLCFEHNQLLDAIDALSSPQFYSMELDEVRDRQALLAQASHFKFIAASTWAELQEPVMKIHRDADQRIKPELAVA